MSTAAQRRRNRQWLRGHFYDGAQHPQTQGAAPGHGANPAAPTMPPPGSYDPGIDYQIQSSQLGLQDLETDTARADRLSERDLQIALQQAERSKHRGVHDIRQDRRRGYSDLAQRLARGQEDATLRRGDAQTSFARDMGDLAVAEQRGGEDRARALAALDRKYTTMGEQQGEAAAAAGYSRGGFAAQSAAKRQANQAIERQPIDVAAQRQGEDIAQRRGREGEDLARSLLGINTSEARLGQDVATDRTRLTVDSATGLRRTRQDTATQESALTRQQRRDARTRALELSRGTRDQALFETAQGQQAFFSAHQNDPHIQYPGAPPRRRRR